MFDRIQGFIESLQFAYLLIDGKGLPSKGRNELANKALYGY